MLKFAIFTFLCIFAIAASQDDPEFQVLKNAVGSFTNNLFHTLYPKYVNKNFMFSPFNIYSSLALLVPGSGGKTYEELAKALGLSSHTPDPASYEILNKFLSNGLNYNHQNGVLKQANGFFVQNGYSLKPTYLDAIKSLHPKLDYVDFHKNLQAATDEVNKYVADKTRGGISPLFTESLSAKTELALISTLYFNFSYEAGVFSEHPSPPSIFHTPDGEVQVQYLNNTGRIMYYEQRGDKPFQFARFPCKGGEFIVDIIVPSENVNLPDLATNLTYLEYQAMIQNLKLARVAYRVPYFHFHNIMNLEEPLKGLSLDHLFDHADLSNTFVDKRPRSLSAMHALDITVNEPGTEAAVGTGIGVEPVSVTSMHVFNVNRPFLIGIKHIKSDVLILCAAISNPTAP